MNEIKDLEVWEQADEIDKLRAQVGRLTGQLGKANDYAQELLGNEVKLCAQVERLRFEANARIRVGEQILMEPKKVLQLLGETPDQSLAEHDAALLEGLAADWANPNDRYIEDTCLMLLEEAQRIKKEAGIDG